MCFHFAKFIGWNGSGKSVILTILTALIIDVLLQENQLNELHWFYRVELIKTGESFATIEDHISNNDSDADEYTLKSSMTKIKRNRCS